MKKSIYLVIALCMIVLSSCSSDDDSSSGSGQGQTARIQLTLTGSSSTRASGTDDPASGTIATNEGAVGNIVVGIFDGSGNKLVVQTVSGTGLHVGSDVNAITVPLVKGTMNGCRGVVVGNVPTASVTALQSAATRSSFLEQTISLEAATASGDNQVSTSLPMSGEVVDASGDGGADGNADSDNNPATFSLTAGGTMVLKAVLVRMASRITLRSLSTNFAGTVYSGATFKLQRVFLRDAIDKNKVTTLATPADAMPSDATYIRGGGTWSDVDKAWISEANNYLFDAQTKGDEPTIGGTSPIPATLPYYWFYALANSSSVHPTAFVIQGLFDPDGGDAANAVPVFYPVVINKYQDGTTGVSEGSTGSIVRNTLYNLSVTIKGKGAASPTDEIDPVSLSIAVEVAGWNTTISQGVDFN